MTDQKGFYGLGIAPGILRVLEYLKFTVPTPIQEQSIPAAIEGKDLVGIAQTGTGKTLAFGIPMIQFVLQDKGIGLVVLPTRELALQVHETLVKVAGGLKLRTAIVIGGAPMRRQMMDIRHRPHIIIGTPGRIIDHMEQRTLSLQNVKMLVLDEADRMLDMGFAPQLKRIMKDVPADRQTMLFSATMPPEIVNIARAFMKLPVRIEIAPPGTAATNVTHEVFVVGRGQKGPLLLKLLTDYRGSVLVFSRTKHGAKKIARAVRDAGHTSDELHSNRSLNQRRSALEGFKTGRYRVLVATDIAARGIDVTGIELVLNYDLPEQAEDYIHRIGRTGRAGASGHAISFVSPDQLGDLRTIERIMKKQLPVSKLPEALPQSLPPQTQYPPKAPFTGQRHQSYGQYAHTNGSFGGRGGQSGGRSGGQSGNRRPSRFPRRRFSR